MSAELFEDDDDATPRRLDLQLWRRIVTHAHPYRLQAAGMVVTGLLVAGVDVSLPLLTAWLIDGAAAGQPLAELAPYGVAYATLLALLAGGIYLFIVLAGQISTGVAHDLRRAGFARLQQLSFSFYDQHPVGWLVARLTSDCGKVSGLLPWLLLDTVWGTSLVLGIAAAMLWLNPLLALVVLLVVPPLVGVSLIFQRMMLESSRKVRRANAMITSSFNESIAGVRTTKALAREAPNLEEFQVLSTDMFTHSMRNALQSAVYLPLVIVLGSLGVGLALWRGGVEVTMGGLTLGTLIAFMQYAKLFSMPIQDMARQFTLLQAAQAAAERVQGLLETVPQIRDSDTPQLPDDPEQIREVAFEDVDFSYKEGEPVLQQCSFEVRQGQTIALVGPTGGGKSTIVKLLSRFYDADAGAIRIDGVPLPELPLGWLQARFGIVLQTPHLFSGTVADNIRYGNLEATDEQVRAAAALVHADRFIEKLPDGYDTDVGEGGGSLSTGQRQLVSLARAVLADPQVFVMDEATSSVDTETEQAIQAGIDALLEDRIAFVIAHRLSTVRNADQILVVDGGRITERGTHASLMGAGGYYAQLVARNTPQARAVADNPAP
ncbi:MAG: ABC transporter ATP-binding protein/permease [Myxococcales bacterium]|nr:ABC transporter ATP-binding protein/permease [Myxococcales bacterium]